MLWPAPRCGPPACLPASVLPVQGNGSPLGRCHYCTRCAPPAQKGSSLRYLRDRSCAGHPPRLPPPPPASLPAQVRVTVGSDLRGQPAADAAKGSLQEARGSEDHQMPPHLSAVPTTIQCLLPPACFCSSSSSASPTSPASARSIHRSCCSTAARSQPSFWSFLAPLLTCHH